MTFQNTLETTRPNNTEQLRKLGWNDHFEQQLAAMQMEREQAVRVLSVQRGQFLVGNGEKEWLCAPTGKLLHQSVEYPVTGDWATANETVLSRVIPRKNILCRGESGSRSKHNQAATQDQPIGANIDTVFIVCGLDRDYNLRRLERYLALIYNCGISPVIVLTKADLHEAPETFRYEVEDIAFGVPVVLSSILTGSGVNELHTYLAPGQTVAMLGSSGAGKSTLTNMLHGSEIQATAEVSSKVGKGRHTTTTRELIQMPQGGMLLDNPGIREIAFYTDGDGLETAFPEIQLLSESCRFADCSHEQEPGCAVLRAVESGELPMDRFESYRKMKREMEYVAARSEKSANRVEKERWKKIALRIRQMENIK